MHSLEAPRQLAAVPVGGGWSVLPAWVPLPGLGALPVNTFVLSGREPMLVDTGIAALGDPLLAALSGVVDPTDLRWIWLSHADPDHTGNLERLLAMAPKAQVLAGFLAKAKLELRGVDTSRFRVLAPGEVVDLGDRALHPLRPPYYDAPETLGFYDEMADVLYAVDSFGAPLPAPVHALADAREEDLVAGMAAWSAIDAPWLASLDPAVRARSLSALARLDPTAVLGAHLPVADDAAGLVRLLEAACRQASPDPLATAAVLERIIEPVPLLRSA